jgi:hypothetical protein
MRPVIDVQPRTCGLADVDVWLQEDLRFASYSLSIRHKTCSTTVVQGLGQPL